MKKASVYLIKDKFVFCSNAKTVNGVNISVPPYIHLTKDDDSNQILNALEEVINANRTDIPHPKQEEWDSLEKDFLEGLKVKSVGVLHDEALLCEVYKRNDNWEFWPTENVGKKKGFLTVGDTHLLASVTATSDEIVGTLKESFNVSKQLSE